MTAMVQYRYFQQQLQSIYSPNEAAIITDWVFEKIAGTNRSAIINNPDEPLNEDIIKQLAESLHELLKHKPVQYVLGETQFYKLKLKVNEQVLIPRPETEELVQWVIESTRTKKPAAILDIGTGSGCIAIALQKNMSGTEVTAIDISKGALKVAKENAATQKTPVNFLQLDFLNDTTWKNISAFDIIVSNPPYIPVAEKNNLDKNVTEYEPHIALFVADDSALIFYEKIAAFGLSHLNPGGKIFVETHELYSTATEELFLKYYPVVEVRQDISGKERMLMASLN